MACIGGLLDTITGSVILTASEVKEIESYIDQLWELVCIMHSELVSCEDNGYVCGGHKFDDRMRELGIKI